MFIIEIAARIEEEIDKLKSEKERRTTYQEVVNDIWFLKKLETKVSNLFLTELVSVGDSVGDFDNESNSFFCKNNVTGEEREFRSIFEWYEWFTQEKNYSDHFSIRRAEWKYEEVILKFEWLGGVKDGGLLERWGIRNLPNSIKEEWSEFLSEVISRANA